MKETVVLSMKKNKRQSGFSLIELLIYIAILISAVTIIAVFTIDIVKVNRAEQGNRATQQNTRLAIERMQYEIRWANSVDTPFQTDEITLQTPNGEVRFYLGTGDAGQQAMFVERDGFSQQLTTDDVEVVNFALETMNPVDAPPSVKINLTIDGLGNIGGSTEIGTIVTVRKN